MTVTPRPVNPRERGKQIWRSARTGRECLCRDRLPWWAVMRPRWDFISGVKNRWEVIMRSVIEMIEVFTVLLNDWE